jgi:hypothetical protein
MIAHSRTFDEDWLASVSQTRKKSWHEEFCDIIKSTTFLALAIRNKQYIWKKQTIVFSQTDVMGKCKKDTKETDKRTINYISRFNS